MNDAICLLSGGQDSTTALFWAKEKFDNVHAVIINYGQRHIIEIESAKKIATLANVDHTEISIPFFKEIGNSALLNSEDVNSSHNSNSKLPASFVPGRNLIFITVAAMLAYKMGFKNIVTGVCETDFSGYPDCRRSTMDSLEETIERGMEFKGIEIHTPLMSIDKAETVHLAETFDGCFDALAFSHTCYKGEYPPCMHCPSCLLRIAGFEKAGIVDPLLWRSQYESKSN